MAQARRSLDDQLDQVRAQLNYLDHALRAAADRAHPPAPGSKEVVVAGHLARLQRLSAQALRSALDEIGGVGPRRRKALLTAFGSVAGVRRATREDLIAVVGAKCADQVLAHFAGQT